MDGRVTSGTPPADLLDEPGTIVSDSGPPVICSEDLLAGGREVVIRHGVDRYRLMLTGRNRLILIK